MTSTPPRLAAIWPSMIAIILIILSNATTSVVASLNDDRHEEDETPNTSPAITPARTSHEKHQIRRNAMEATIADHASSFASVQEQRSYYYLHAGMEMAAFNALIMSGHEADEFFDDDNYEESDVYLGYLEGMMEAELARVRMRLSETMGGEAAEDENENMDNQHDTETVRDYEELKMEMVEDGDDANDNDSDNTEVEEEEEEEEEDTAEKFTPKQRLQVIFKEQKDHFQCGKLSSEIMSLSEVEGKWKEIHRHFWNFVDADYHRIPSDTRIKHADHAPNPDLRIGFINKNEGNTTENMGLFAARDFDKGEVVYTLQTNPIFFPDESIYVEFLHSLPTSRDACLALDMSFRKQVSAPGRWLMGLALDEGGFMWTMEGDAEDIEEKCPEHGIQQYSICRRRMNVALDHDRSFEYMATREIKKGDEIIEGPMPMPK